MLTTAVRLGAGIRELKSGIAPPPASVHIILFNQANHERKTCGIRFLFSHNFVQPSKLCSQKVAAKRFHVHIILFSQANYAQCCQIFFKFLAEVIPKNLPKIDQRLPVENFAENLQKICKVSSSKTVGRTVQARYQHSIWSPIDGHRQVSLYFMISKKTSPTLRLALSFW